MTRPRVTRLGHIGILVKHQELNLGQLLVSCLGQIPRSGHVLVPVKDNQNLNENAETPNLLF